MNIQLPPRLESYNQRKIILYYERQGWYVNKLIQTTKNGSADLILHRIDPLTGIPITFYIEAKRTGKGADALQKYRIKELKKYGIETLVLDAPL